MRIFTKKIAVVFVLTLFVMVFAGCAKQKNEKISKEAYTMGTYIDVTVYHPNLKEAEEIIDKAFKKVKEMEQLMSINIADSEIIRVNKAAGKKAVSVSDDTFRVVKTGIKYSELTEGQFDITIGPVVKLWNIGFENARVPDKKEIDEKLALVDYKMVEVDQKGKKIKLKREDMMIDLGGIAKGYAADKVREILKEGGIEHAIINLGGNILTLEEKPDGSQWKVGIQDPRPYVPRGRYMGIVSVVNKAVVTSGDYERFIEKDGKRYHHILDPDTGMPADTGIISVTIVTENATDADALSTSVFVLGPEKGLELINRLEGVEAIIITKDLEVIVTEGLKGNFKITNDEFRMKSD